MTPTYIIPKSPKLSILSGFQYSPILLREDRRLQLPSGPWDGYSRLKRPRNTPESRKLCSIHPCPQNVQFHKGEGPSGSGVLGCALLGLVGRSNTEDSGYARVTWHLRKKVA